MTQSEPRTSLEDVLTRKWCRNAVTSRQKVLNLLLNSTHELSISQVARKLEISWVTARNALTELLALSLVKGERKGRELVFILTNETRENSFTIENDGKIVTFRYKPNFEALMATKNIVVMLKNYGVNDTTRKLKRALTSQKSFPKTIPLTTINQAVTQILRSLPKGGE